MRAKGKDVGELALVVATLGLVVATLLLWWEGRRGRTEANLVVWVAPWDIAHGIYAAVLLQNAGPVISRDIRLTWRLVRPVGGQNGVLNEPIMDVGFRRTIPMKWATLNALAAEGATIEADLSWQDGRRGRQTQSLQVSLRQVKEDYDKSAALPRPSELEVLDKIREQLEAIAKK